MDIKHTTGPWGVVRIDDCLAIMPDPITGYPDTFLGVALVQDHVGERPSDRVAANARLIASAPDLLRALAQLELAVTDIRGIDMESYCGPALDQARAAIAKATGSVAT